MSELSECFREMCFFLASVVSTVGSMAYSFYLIWLVAYLEKNGYYWFFAFIPALYGIPSLIVLACSRDRKYINSTLFSVMILEMCFFTMLTRQAYYHLSADDFIGPQWVIMSLKGSIIFFVSGFLIEKECRLQRILKGKDILSRGLLDFVDIFNLVDILSLNRCVGIGSTVTEGSSLEMAIQAFCTMSLMTIVNIHDLSDTERGTLQYNGIHFASFGYQNFPFLIIRIIVWAKYNYVFSLGFMTKNILAVIVCWAVIRQQPSEAKDSYRMKTPQTPPRRMDPINDQNGEPTNTTQEEGGDSNAVSIVSIPDLKS